ncbi:hypothetical protein BASA81_000644 [Batrachochytrium salamandrivorans]|nr:hypothetical protein BASA81_000644 [Batrachochytrium salamandrivorans]
MGRKSRTGEKKAERPNCFYCVRQFDNEDTLFQHQKCIHFRCENCGKKFGNAPALGVHMKTMHEMELKSVPKADFGRDNPLLHIVGTEGAPVLLLQEGGGEAGAAAFEANKRLRLGSEPAAAAAAQQPANGGLVFADETQSQEEKRAGLARYRFDEGSLNAKLSQLNASIQDRMQQALARRRQAA